VEVYHSIMRAVVLVLVVVSVAACGAQPSQPALANVPKPNTAAVAGGAAAAAAAITLASPDSHNPEQKQVTEKKAIEVKENVPADVLDRADATAANAPAADAKASAPAPPATTSPPRSEAKKTQPKPRPAGTDAGPKAPRDALDFSNH
jgi:hypothetical protein